MLRKTALSIACLCALLTLSAPVFADTLKTSELDAPYTTISPRYSHLSNFYADCNKKSNYVEVYANVSTYGKNYQASLSVTLQKQSGSQWKNIKTWTSSGSGLDGVDVSQKYYVTDGTYRVKATAKILDGTKVLETATIYG